MLALLFILQFTKSNGYDGTRGLTGIGVIGDTDQGCQCQCFDPNLGFRNQSSEFIYVQSKWHLSKTNKAMRTFCPSGYAYTREPVLPNLAIFAETFCWIWIIDDAKIVHLGKNGILKIENLVTLQKGMCVELELKNGEVKDWYNMALTVKIFFYIKVNLFKNQQNQIWQNSFLWIDEKQNDYCRGCDCCDCSRLTIECIQENLLPFKTNDTSPQGCSVDPRDNVR